MGKVSHRMIAVSERKKLTGEVVALLSHFGLGDEGAGFLVELLTASERIMLGRRILVAKSLLEGRTYADIRESHSVGAATIIAVDKVLRDALPGYRKVLIRQRGKGEKATPIPQLLTKKYPKSKKLLKGLARI